VQSNLCDRLVLVNYLKHINTVMIHLPGYQITDLIYESLNSLVYRGERESDCCSVVLKVLKENYSDPAIVVRYKQEYEMTRFLSIEGAVTAYEMHAYQDTVIIVLEDFGGESLKILLSNPVHQQAFTTLQELLPLAIKITQALGQVHAAEVIHKDINPSNIVFNPATNQLKIIDFGISTRLTRELKVLQNPNFLEGTLAYLSPEQTGRMNRSVDYRTDFYSLGVTFYELLTGRLPFETDDPLELVHCHIAKQPLSPDHINPAIPESVARIVLKLMAKTAEDRYQSAWGLQADLEACLEQWQTQRQINALLLGTHDISDRFQIPQKLYGRDQEITQLISAFDRVAKISDASLTQDIGDTAKSELLLVTGYSGIGKSALVCEIYKPITATRGYFIAGKFDQFQRNIPYAAVVEAFKDLVRQLLTESAEQLARWQQRLLHALGTNGQIIIDVIPEIELIIGQQPEVPKLEATESQNRFDRVFQNFIRAIAALEHPLVIFLDDLQWIDAASLKLLSLIMTDTEVRHLLLLGAYRDNEVDSSHPLKMTLELLRQDGAAISQIVLTPLQIEHVTQVVADTLKADYPSVLPLAELVLQKTNGNPFFVCEFLKALYDENLLSFDRQFHRWIWNITQIKAMDITDNVVELMIGKLKQLPKATQDTLHLAACIGAKFDLTTLAQVCDRSPAHVFQDLMPAIQSGLILTQSELNEALLIQNHQFLHDRVQQSAYFLQDETSRKVLHLKIGQILLNNLLPAEKDKKIFNIVDHLNLGQAQFAKREERVELARLNLEVGRKAKEASAYKAASQYLTMGLHCLDESSWQDHYQLALDLHRAQAEVEYLLSNFERSRELIAIVLDCAKSLVDKVEIYNLLIVQYTLKTQYTEAINTGRTALQLLGIHFPEENFTDFFEQEHNRLKQRLGDRALSELLNLPEITDPEKKLAVKLLSNLGSAAYRYQQSIWQTIVVISIHLFLDYGNIPESCYGYSNYGTLLGSVLGDYQSGYESCLVSLRLSEQYRNLTQKSRACFILSNFVQSWVKHVKEADAINLQGAQAGLESGEIQYVGYTISYRISNLFFQGKPLEDLLNDLLNALSFCQKARNQWAIDALSGYQLIITNLQTVDDQALPQQSALHEANYSAACVANKSFSGLCRYYILKSMLLYLLEQYEDSLKYADLAADNLTYILGVISAAEHHFFSALTLIQLHSTTPEQQYLIRLDAHQQQLKHWADSCPENFLHQLLLVQAEIARISGRVLEAIDLYDRAIELANQHEFIHIAALGNELAAKFWLTRDKPAFARVYLRKARYLYQLWGAKRKVEQIDQKYASLLVGVSQSAAFKNSKTVSNSGHSSSAAFDLAALIKASQAISGEIVLDKLLAKFMQILIENAGARVGYLVLESQGKLFIEASCQVSDETVTVLQSLPIQQFLPVTIINYVVRTQKSIVLNHAIEDRNFANDPYIQQQQSRSILCMPLIHQGKTAGILYLENDLAVGAFTQDRLEILNLLSSQAAISLENAKLYSTLEQKVAERTQELAQEKAKSERLLLNILPQSIAERLKQNQQVIADGFADVTVLFSDIVGFSQLASVISPQTLVDFLNKVFSVFDQLCDRHGLEKIKTIGDAYMAVSGLTDSGSDRVMAIADMALDMQQAVKHLALPVATSEAEHPLRIRIGIHTGPVIAGVIGTKKFSYDLWGDTVNVASRMEAQGEPDLIQVTDVTYERLKSHYWLKERGSILVKGKGTMKTYWLLGKKSAEMP
jgi:predicted ATPase/class 3 adenylate cyclase